MKPEAIKAAARAGYASRGIIYVILGGLAVAGSVGAAGYTGEAQGTKGALLELFDTGFGTVLLVLIALGLFCYSAWRLIQSLADADDHGTDAKGLVVRGGLLVSAVTHTALGAWALHAALAGASGRSEGGGGGAAGWLMQQPFGPWLVMGVGVCIIGAGVAHIVKGATCGFEKWLKADEDKMTFIRPVSMTGLIARGIVFLIVGGFFIYAGFTFDPEKAGGTREALQWLRQQPYGFWLYLVIAFGLLCFGLYSLTEAAYRRIAAAEV